MTLQQRTSLVVVVVAVLAFVTLLGACSSKAQEPFRDAPKTETRNNDPAQIIEMPDGFSNLASKCDGTNRIYVIFKADQNRGAVAVVPNDPRCR